MEEIYIRISKKDGEALSIHLHTQTPRHRVTVDTRLACSLHPLHVLSYVPFRYGYLRIWRAGINILLFDYF
jgi:hypothetical protein